MRPFAPADAVVTARFLPATMGGAWTPQRLHALLDSSHKLRVLTQAGQVLGYAEYLQVLDEAELLALAITPECQGKGLGALLLQAVMKELQAAGCRRCLLEVRRSNTRAQRLYTGMAFVQVGIRKGYYPGLQPDGQAEDALLYSCLLESS